MIQNEYVYAIGEGYGVLNFEGASFSSFRDIEKSFRDGGGGRRR